MEHVLHWATLTLLGAMLWRAGWQAGWKAKEEWERQHEEGRYG